MMFTKKHKRHIWVGFTLLFLLCLFVAPSVVADPSQGSVIIVNERALVGPNSAAQLRGGRLFLPVATIAEALGDTLSSDSMQRIVTVRRQNGTIGVFNAPLNEVRENGAVILTVSGTADLVFPPTPYDLMLPAEIVAALLDVTVRRDENQAIVVARKGLKPETVRTGGSHVRFELFQLEYDYNFTRYSSAGDHSLVLRGTGRVGDAKLTFIANSAIGVTQNSSRPSLQGGTVRLDRPNGQSFVGGEFGTGTDVEFLGAAVRGGLVQLPFDRVRLDFFVRFQRLPSATTQKSLGRSQPLRHTLHVNVTSRFPLVVCTSAARVAEETCSPVASNTFRVLIVFKLMSRWASSQVSTAMRREQTEPGWRSISPGLITCSSRWSCKVVILTSAKTF
jgi:hypothetical protein